MLLFPAIFQAKSCIIVKDISVTGGTLGRREIAFQFGSMKDYVRIESVAGPPAKLKFIDLDPEQVGFIFVFLVKSVHVRLLQN